MITTRTGDDGTTSLIGGRRVKKDDVIIEAIGTVDELDAQLGVLAVAVEREMVSMSETLRNVQQGLYFVKVLLAGVLGDDREKALRRLREGTVGIEQAAAAIERQLPTLKGFVLLGQTMESAQCHVVRSVCRRAERQVVAAEIDDKDVCVAILPYINRLSDYLFDCARILVINVGVAERYISID